jgi:hypothetical protein
VGDGAYLLIATNLLSALRPVPTPNSASPALGRCDSICQNDMKEQGLQVSLMRQICQNAKCTLIYLGDEADNSDLAVAFVDELDLRYRGKLVDAINRPHGKKNVDVLDGEISLERNWER